MYIHNNPVAHRTHKKSTTGCKACKLRKIKCDEKKPVCGRCTIHFSNLVACDYASAPKSKTNSKKKVSSTISAVATPKDILPKPVEIVLLPEAVVSPTSRTIPKSPSVSKLSSSPSSGSTLRADRGDYGNPTCPCQLPVFTHLMLDATLSTCKICGNQPGSEKGANQYSPVSDFMRSSGSIDPFSILPAKSSPRVHALAYHWHNTLALFPTKIHSQYCTNPEWVSQAVNNEVFFNATLYVSAVHDAGLRGKRGTPESLYYKAQTIRVLNKSLRDPKVAVQDETLAAVLLLTHVVSLIGEPNEVEIHMKGLQQMMTLRGGIRKYTLDGVFLHMLCIVNHLTAVISESPTIIPPSGIPYKPKTKFNSCTTSSATTSPLLKPFACSIGFHPAVVDLLYDMEYLYGVVDAFTTKLIPEFRGPFEDVIRSINIMKGMDEKREEEWVLSRLKSWGSFEVGANRGQGEGVKV